MDESTINDMYEDLNDKAAKENSRSVSATAREMGRSQSIANQPVEPAIIQGSTQVPNLAIGSQNEPVLSPEDEAEQVGGSLFSIIDGDTFDYKGERMRLRRADAPELSQKGGLEAREALERALKSGKASVVPVEKDKYGRTVADVYVDGKLVVEGLIRDGKVWHFEGAETKDSRALLDAQNAATSEGLGIHGATGSLELEPSIYRKQSARAENREAWERRVKAYTDQLSTVQTPEMVKALADSIDGDDDKDKKPDKLTRVKHVSNAVASIANIAFGIETTGRDIDGAYSYELNRVLRIMNSVFGYDSDDYLNSGFKSCYDAARQYLKAASGIVRRMEKEQSEFESLSYEEKQEAMNQSFFGDDKSKYINFSLQDIEAYSKRSTVQGVIEMALGNGVDEDTIATGVMIALSDHQAEELHKARLSRMPIEQARQAANVASAIRAKYDGNFAIKGLVSLWNAGEAVANNIWATATGSATGSADEERILDVLAQDLEDAKVDTDSFVDEVSVVLGSSIPSMALLAIPYAGVPLYAASAYGDFSRTPILEDWHNYDAGTLEAVKLTYAAAAPWIEKGIVSLAMKPVTSIFGKAGARFGLPSVNTLAMRLAGAEQRTAASRIALGLYETAKRSVASGAAEVPEEVLSQIAQTGGAWIVDPTSKEGRKLYNLERFSNEVIDAAWTAVITGPFMTAPFATTGVVSEYFNLGKQTLLDQVVNHGNVLGNALEFHQQSVNAFATIDAKEQAKTLGGLSEEEIAKFSLASREERQKTIDSTEDKSKKKWLKELDTYMKYEEDFNSKLGGDKKPTPKVDSETEGAAKRLRSIANDESPEPAPAPEGDKKEEESKTEEPKKISFDTDSLPDEDRESKLYEETMPTHTIPSTPSKSGVRAGTFERIARSELPVGNAMVLPSVSNEINAVYGEKVGDDVKLNKRYVEIFTDAKKAEEETGVAILDLFQEAYGAELLDMVTYPHSDNQLRQKPEEYVEAVVYNLIEDAKRFKDGDTEAGNRLEAMRDKFKERRRTQVLGKREETAGRMKEKRRLAKEHPLLRKFAAFSRRWLKSIFGANSDIYVVNDVEMALNSVSLAGEVVVDAAEGTLRGIEKGIYGIIDQVRDSFIGGKLKQKRTMPMAIAPFLKPAQINEIKAMTREEILAKLNSIVEEEPAAAPIVKEITKKFGLEEHQFRAASTWRSAESIPESAKTVKLAPVDNKLVLDSQKIEGIEGLDMMTLRRTLAAVESVRSIVAEASEKERREGVIKKQEEYYAMLESEYKAKLSESAKKGSKTRKQNNDIRTAQSIIDRISYEDNYIAEIKKIPAGQRSQSMVDAFKAAKSEKHKLIELGNKLVESLALRVLRGDSVGIHPYYLQRVTDKAAELVEQFKKEHPANTRTPEQSRELKDAKSNLHNLLTKKKENEGKHTATRLFKNKKGVVYAAIKDGNVFVSRYANPVKVLHEVFGHGTWAWMRENDKAGYKELLNEARNAPQAIKDNVYKKYKDVYGPKFPLYEAAEVSDEMEAMFREEFENSDIYLDEVFAHLIEAKFEGRISELFETPKELAWYERFWNSIVKAFKRAWEAITGRKTELPPETLLDVLSERFFGYKGIAAYSKVITSNEGRYAFDSDEWEEQIDEMPEYFGEGYNRLLGEDVIDYFNDDSPFNYSGDNETKNMKSRDGLRPSFTAPIDYGSRQVYAEAENAFYDAQDRFEMASENLKRVRDTQGRDSEEYQDAREEFLQAFRQRQIAYATLASEHARRTEGEVGMFELRNTVVDFDIAIEDLFESLGTNKDIGFDFTREKYKDSNGEEYDVVSPSKWDKFVREKKQKLKGTERKVFDVISDIASVFSGDPAFSRTSFDPNLVEFMEEELKNVEKLVNERYKSTNTAYSKRIGKQIDAAKRVLALAVVNSGVYAAIRDIVYQEIGMYRPSGKRIGRDDQEVTSGDHYNYGAKFDDDKFEYKGSAAALSIDSDSDIPDVDPVRSIQLAKHYKEFMWAEDMLKDLGKHENKYVAEQVYLWKVILDGAKRAAGDEWFVLNHPDKLDRMLKTYKTFPEALKAAMSKEPQATLESHIKSKVYDYDLAKQKRENEAKRKAEKRKKGEEEKPYRENAEILEQIGNSHLVNQSMFDMIRLLEKDNVDREKNVEEKHLLTVKERSKLIGMLKARAKTTHIEKMIKSSNAEIDSAKKNNVSDSVIDALIEKQKTLLVIDDNIRRLQQELMNNFLFCLNKDRLYVDTPEFNRFSNITAQINAATESILIKKDNKLYTEKTVKELGKERKAAFEALSNKNRLRGPKEISWEITRLMNKAAAIDRFSSEVEEDEETPLSVRLKTQKQYVDAEEKENPNDFKLKKLLAVVDKYNSGPSSQFRFKFEESPFIGTRNDVVVLGYRVPYKMVRSIAQLNQQLINEVVEEIEEIERFKYVDSLGKYKRSTMTGYESDKHTNENDTERQERKLAAAPERLRNMIEENHTSMHPVDDEELMVRFLGIRKTPFNFSDLKNKERKDLSIDEAKKLLRVPRSWVGMFSYMSEELHERIESDIRAKIETIARNKLIIENSFRDVNFAKYPDNVAGHPRDEFTSMSTTKTTKDYKADDGTRYSIGDEETDGNVPAPEPEPTKPQSEESDKSRFQGRVYSSVVEIAAIAVMRMVSTGKTKLSDAEMDNIVNKYDKYLTGTPRDRIKDTANIIAGLTMLIPGIKNKSDAEILELCVSAIENMNGDTLTRMIEMVQNVQSDSWKEESERYKKEIERLISSGRTQRKSVMSEKELRKLNIVKENGKLHISSFSKASRKVGIAIFGEKPDRANYTSEEEYEKAVKEHEEGMKNPELIAKYRDTLVWLFGSYASNKGLSSHFDITMVDSVQQLVDRMAEFADTPDDIFRIGARIEHILRRDRMSMNRDHLKRLIFMSLNDFSEDFDPRKPLSARKVSPWAHSFLHAAQTGVNMTKKQLREAIEEAQHDFSKYNMLKEDGVDSKKDAKKAAERSVIALQRANGLQMVYESGMYKDALPDTESLEHVYDTINRTIDEGRQAVKEHVDKENAIIESFVGKLEEALSKGKSGTVDLNSAHKSFLRELKDRIGSLVVDGFTLSQRLEDMLRFVESPQLKAELKLLMDEVINTPVAEAHSKQAEVYTSYRDRLDKIISSNYLLKNNATPAEVLKVLNELNKPMKELARFSSSGTKKLTRAQVMAQIAMLAQKDVRLPILDLEQGLLSGEYVWNASDKVGDKADATVLTPEQKTLVTRLRNESAMIEALDKLSNGKDLGMIDKLRGFFASIAPELDKTSSGITGAPISINEQNYFPVYRSMEWATRGINRSRELIGFVPDFMSPRRYTTTDISEDADVFSIFTERAEEMAHFMAFGPLHYRAALLMDDKRFTHLTNRLLGSNNSKELKDAIQDVFAPNLLFIDNSGANVFWSAMRRFSVMVTLGGNILSGLKQVTSIASFSNEVGWRQLVSSLLKNPFSDEMNKARKELMNSPEAKARWGSEWHGIQEDLMSRPGKGMFSSIAWSKYMIAQRYGDFVPSFIAAPGIYLATKERLLSRMNPNTNKPYTEEEATRLAQTLTFDVIEKTQQTDRTSNLGRSQRRGNALSQAFGQFQSSQILYMSAEIRAIRDVFSSYKNRDNWSKLGGILLSNHIVVPALLKGLELMVSWILSGEEPDEDDLKDLIVLMLSGPLSGLVLLGQLALSPFDEYKRDVTAPMVSFAGRVIRGGAKIFEDTFEGDWEDIPTDVNTLVKTLIPLYRDATKPLDWGESSK